MQSASCIRRKVASRPGIMVKSWASHPSIMMHSGLLTTVTLTVAKPDERFRNSSIAKRYYADSLTIRGAPRILSD
jgi:hypothetical protein